MALTGKAKTDYQREYMRRRRSNQGSNVTAQSVRPKELDPVRRKGNSKLVYNKATHTIDAVSRDGTSKQVLPEPQSHNPMMVGYVPPEKVSS